MSLTKRVQHTYYGVYDLRMLDDVLTTPWGAVSYSPLSKAPRLREHALVPRIARGRAGWTYGRNATNPSDAWSVNGVSDATNHLSRLRNILHGRPDGQTTRRPDGRTSSRKAGDERAPLTGKPKACEAVKNWFVFCSGCLFRRPRPFGFRHSGRAVFRSRGFLKEERTMDLV